MSEIKRNFLRDKTVIVMGGGTSGWTTALHLLHHSLINDFNIHVQVVASDKVGPIGVGEGTTPYYNQSLKNHCKISQKDFLKGTKGSLKYGIKFDNWNFDQKYYYHMFSGSKKIDESYYLAQFALDNNLDLSNMDLQRFLHGDLGMYIMEENKIPYEDFETYSYSHHFSSDLLIEFLKKECESFENFSYREGKIEEIVYDERGYIKTLCLGNNLRLDGDFFVNCLGFNSTNLIAKEYFDIVLWDKYILNNSAFAMQVKNEENEELNFYTSATAQEYGWCWKIPQYEKTGYGYVFSDQFITDESKLFDDILKTYNIKESNVIGTRLVKSKPYLNKKQIHKNCLSMGLSSGFVEPLEATSIHLIIMGLQHFCEIGQNDLQSQFHYNKIMEEEWNNVFEFIVYHYQTKNPINEYWQHYVDIKRNKKLPFRGLYTCSQSGMFQRSNYSLISLGMEHKNKNIKNPNLNITEEKIYTTSLEQNKTFHSELPIKTILTHKQLLDKIINEE